MGNHLLVKNWIMFALGIALLLPARASRAQLAAPNEAGVSMGHIDLNVADIDASRKFYVEIGGTPVSMGQTQGVRYPGVIIWLRKAEPSGGTEGSSVNHIGFFVKDRAALMAKMQAQGAKIVGGYLYSPDGVKIEIGGRTELAAPAEFDQIHFFVADPAPDGGPSWSELQAWYTKIFGATPTTTTLVAPKSGLPAYSQSEIPGVHLKFSKVDGATLGTKGRALDHIGFEVKNLQAFCRKLEAEGVKFDRPYGELPALGISYAFVTDPWGTYIELNESLGKL